MMTALILLLAAVVFQNGVLCEQQKAEKIRSRRSLSNNIEIYTMDHFIAMVEKIERHNLTQEKPLKVIANYIRKLGYESDKWTLLLGSQTESLPDGVLTTQEKNVMTKMIKHRFLGQQEEGVVHTPFGDVAMGRVITGICAGITRNKAVIIQQLYQITSKHIDNLYAATIAGDVGLSALVNKVNPSTPLFGPGGTWSPTSQCPQTFNAENPSLSKATDAEILGGIDGFLMGHKILSLLNTYEVRLEQLLRMYYHGGMVYDNMKQYAACKRMTTFREMVTEKELTEQVSLGAYAAKAAWNKDLDFSKVQYSDIPQLGKTTTQQFYTYIKNLPLGNSCPVVKDEGCSFTSNIVFVLDESGSITSPNYKVEKDVVEKIIDAFDISSYQTRVAVVEYADVAHETIQLDDFSSKSTLVCAVHNLHYGRGGTVTSKALETAFKILKNAQSSAGSKHINDPQIMVLLTDGKSNDGEAVLKPIVENIKKNMRGLTIMTVGIGKYKQSELELIATDPSKHVFTTTDFSRLRKQICETSTVLRPVASNNDELNVDQQTNTEVEVTGYLNPGKPRFFTLPTETLFKTENISIQIKPTYGTVTLYGSRSNASPGPDNHDFRYQAIYGENSTNSCSDRDCSVPNQIKFEITAAQIIKKQENICYLELPAEMLINAASISIKVLPINDSITLYTSRTHKTPNDDNNDYKLTAKETGRERILMIAIAKPCKGYNKASQCSPLYMSFRGSHVMCDNCRAGRICETPPKQITITIKQKIVPQVRDVRSTKICLHRLSSKTLLEVKSVQIKVSPLNGTVEMYTSRINKQPDKSNHTGKIDAVAIGNSSMLRIDDPCSGYAEDTCPPVYLSFKGRKLSCNCTTDEADGHKRCTLPEDVTIEFTKGQPSTAVPIKISILLAIISVLLSLVS